MKEEQPEEALNDSEEVRSARQLSQDPQGLQAFWEERYRQDYHHVFDQASEFGRYGVIAEYVQRIAPGLPVLDLGCGTGVLALFLPAALYSGIDLTPSAIDAARRRFPDHHFLCQDLRVFEPTSRFGTIVFNESLYYLRPEEIHELLGRLSSWTLAPCLLVLSYYSRDRSCVEAFDIFRTYVSLIDGVAVEKVSGEHSWTVVAGFLNGVSSAG